MNKTMSQERIQVITGVERRRHFTAEQKMRLCEECDRPGMTVSYVARTHGIARSQLFHWRHRMAEGSREAAEMAKRSTSAYDFEINDRRAMERILLRMFCENLDDDSEPTPAALLVEELHSWLGHGMEL